MIFCKARALAATDVEVDENQQAEFRRLMGRRVEDCSQGEYGCNCLMGCEMFADSSIDCSTSASSNVAAMDQAYRNTPPDMEVVVQSQGCNFEGVWRAG